MSDMFQMLQAPKEGRGVVKVSGVQETDDGAAPTSSRSFPPRGSEISSTDQRREEAAVVTGRRTSLSPLCLAIIERCGMPLMGARTITRTVFH